MNVLLEKINFEKKCLNLYIHEILLLVNIFRFYCKNRMQRTHIFPAIWKHHTCIEKNICFGFTLLLIVVYMFSVYVNTTQPPISCFNVGNIQVLSFLVLHTSVVPSDAWSFFSYIGQGLCVTKQWTLAFFYMKNGSCC